MKAYLHPLSQFEPKNTPKPFSSLVAEVGEWSKRNFGDNDGLNEVGPFLGVVEEFCGEFISASGGDGPDAIADTFIFLADCFYRTGTHPDRLEWDFISETINRNDTLVAIGDASHAILKKRQGIRAVSGENVSFCLEKVFFCLNSYFQYCHGADVGSIVWEVWESVKKRDWRENPETAHEVASKS